MKSFFLIASCALLCSLGGCSLLDSSPSSKAKDGLQQAAASKNDEFVPGVEIIWRVPPGKIDGFILNYGYEPNAIQNRVVLRKDVLKMTPTETWGPVYRYMLKPVTPDKDIYFTLESFKGDQFSEASKMEKIEPSKQAILDAAKGGA